MLFSIGRPGLPIVRIRVHRRAAPGKRQILRTTARSYRSSPTPFTYTLSLSFSPTLSTLQLKLTPRRNNKRRRPRNITAAVEYYPSIYLLHRGCCMAAYGLIASQHTLFCCKPCLQLLQTMLTSLHRSTLRHTRTSTSANSRPPPTSPRQMTQ